MHIYSKNKKAKFDFELKEKYLAGISLLGTEVKSIKNGGCDLTQSYIYIDNKNNAQWLNGYISKYEFQTTGTHEERRTRQLLLSKKEIRKIKNEVQLNNSVLIPYSLGANKRGKLKLEFYVSKPKKNYDKRETIKKRDSQRESKRFLDY